MTTFTLPTAATDFVDAGIYSANVDILTNEGDSRITQRDAIFRVITGSTSQLANTGIDTYVVSGMGHTATVTAASGQETSYANTAFINPFNFDAFAEVAFLDLEDSTYSLLYEDGFKILQEIYINPEDASTPLNVVADPTLQENLNTLMENAIDSLPYGNLSIAQTRDIANFFVEQTGQAGRDITSWENDIGGYQETVRPGLNGTEFFRTLTGFKEHTDRLSGVVNPSLFSTPSNLPNLSGILSIGNSSNMMNNALRNQGISTGDPCQTFNNLFGSLINGGSFYDNIGLLLKGILQGYISDTLLNSDFREILDGYLQIKSLMETDIKYYQFYLDQLVRNALASNLLSFMDDPCSGYILTHIISSSKLKNVL